MKAPPLHSKEENHADLMTLYKSSRVLVAGCSSTCDGVFPFHPGETQIVE
jgi:hypothetical protein